jgi:zeta-carotene desaturase
VEEVIDNSQHLLLGCCTNLLDLYGRLGARDHIRWYRDFYYLEPGGRMSVLAPSALPAPLHTLPAFLRMRCFSPADKLAIARGLLPFLVGVPPDTGETFAAWLDRHGQTTPVRKRFWEPILASALNEDFERMSVSSAGQVIHETFLRSPAAGRMGIPLEPLSVLYGRAAAYIAARGGEVCLRASAEGCARDGVGWIVSAAVDHGTQQFASDAVVLALPFEAMLRLLPSLPPAPGADALHERLQQFEHSPITGVHLWFDRQITALPHAVLLDSTIQWMFNRTVMLSPQDQGPSQIELVVSASRQLTPMPRQQVIDLSLAELGRFFPAVRGALLVKAAVTKEVRATFSVRPGLDALRPGPQSPWKGIFLAGDWTASGWPATMEGGVRSGYRAAEAVADAAGEHRKFLVPDLAASGWMRWVPGGRT